MYNNSMFNNNAFKTSIMFLLIIFVGIMVRMFLTQDELFVKKSSTQATASIACSTSEIC